MVEHLPVDASRVEVAVVVDANVIIASPRLSSAAWRAALFAHSSGALALRVPEVALLEAVAWYERELPERVERYERARGQLDYLGLRDDSADRYGALSADLAKELRIQYPSYLRSQLGEEAILPIPAAEHGDLVRRAVSRTKPFDKHGSGYRDALIWESVCSLARDRTVVFVSDNVHDFADDSQECLAIDLLADLESRGIPQANVSLFRSLHDVVVAYAPDAADQRSIIERAFGGAALLRQLDERFSDDFVTFDGIPMPAGSLPSRFMAEAVAQAVFDSHNVVIDHVKAVGDFSYVVFGSARATAEAYSFCDRPDERIVEGILESRAAGDLARVEEQEEGLILYAYIPVEIQFEAVIEKHGSVTAAAVASVRPAAAT